MFVTTIFTETDAEVFIRHFDRTAEAVIAELRDLADDPVSIPLVQKDLQSALGKAIEQVESFKESAHQILPLLDTGDTQAMEAARLALYLALGPGRDGRDQLSVAPVVDARLDEVMSAVGKTPANLLKDGPDAGTDVGPSDVRFEACRARGTDGLRWARIDLHIGQAYLEKAAAPFSFKVDVGKAVLGFDAQASQGVSFKVRWDLRLGAGVTDLGSRDMDNLFVDAGKTLSGEANSISVPEFSAEVIVTPAPPTSPRNPSLSARAGLGAINAYITDGIPNGTSIVAASSVLEACGKSLCGPASSNGFSVTGTFADGTTRTWRVSHTATRPSSLALVTGLNEATMNAKVAGCALMEAISKGMRGTVVPELMSLCKSEPVPSHRECFSYPEWAIRHLYPWAKPTKDRSNLYFTLLMKATEACRKADAALPVAKNVFPDIAASLDFSDVSGTAGSAARPRLEITARNKRLVRLRIDGGTEYGFREGQEDGLGAPWIGFRQNQLSSGTVSRQVLTAAAPLPAGGALANDEDFFVMVRESATAPATPVLVSLTKERLRGVASPSDLFDVVRDVTLAELDRGTAFPGQFEVEKADAGGKIALRLVSLGSSGRPAPLTSIALPGPQDLEKTSVTLRAGLDVAPNNGYTRSAFDPGYFATYPLYLGSNGAVEEAFARSLTAEAALRFHVDGKAGSAAELEQPPLPGSAPIGLPAITFDMRTNPSYSYVPGKGLKSTPDRVVLEHVSLDVRDLATTVFEPVAAYFRDVMADLLGTLGIEPYKTWFLPGPLANIGRLPRRTSDHISIESLVEDGGKAAALEEFQTRAAQLVSFPEIMAPLARHGVFDFGCMASDTQRQAQAVGTVLTPFRGRIGPCELIGATTELPADTEAASSYVRKRNLTEPTDQGFQFDILQFDKLSDFINGANSDIVSFRLGTPNLKASSTHHYYWYGQPNAVRRVDPAFEFAIAAEAGINAGLVAFYDTTGLREVATAVDGGVDPSPRALGRGLDLIGRPGGIVDATASFTGSGSYDGPTWFGEGDFARGTLDVWGRATISPKDPNGNGRLDYDEVVALTRDGDRMWCAFVVTSSDRTVSSGEAYMNGHSYTAADMGLDVRPLDLGSLMSPWSTPHLLRLCDP